MKSVICAIDQGTTSTRAILFDQEANIVSVAQREFPSYYPQPGWVEQNPDEIWGSVVGVIYEALAKASLSSADIAAFAITNQRETTIVFDKKTGKPVHFALVWQSRQSAHYCDQMKEKGLEEPIRQKTGLVMDAYFSASKIRWILDQLPNGQQRAENGELGFATIDTWLVYKLTQGKLHITDATNASRTQLFNLHTGQWDSECLQWWNIPLCMMPKVCNTSEVYGYTDSDLFQHEIPIAALVGDQQAALFGQTCFVPGTIKNTYGTGCFLLMNTGSQPILSTHGLLSTVAWKINNKMTYALEGSVFVAGAAIQWLRDGLQIIEHAADSEELAISVKSSDGVVVVPAFVGLGAPYWQQEVKGAIFGLSRGTSKEHLVRATLESLALQTRDVVVAMSDDSNLPIVQLKVDGGASRNQFLMQFQADLLGVVVHGPIIRETTALGAAFLAGLAIGFWKDLDEIKQKWQVEQIFEPNITEEEREVMIKQWQKAIEAVCVYRFKK